MKSRINMYVELEVHVWGTNLFSMEFGSLYLECIVELLNQYLVQFLVSKKVYSTYSHFCLLNFLFNHYTAYLFFQIFNIQLRCQLKTFT